MKNILIITLYGNFNYGNKFQNYAMQTTLNKLGFNAYTNSNLYMQNSNTISKRVKKFIKKIMDMPNQIVNRRKTRIFENFSNKYLSLKRYSRYQEINEEIGAICIGSDQIWNPYFIKDFYYSYGQFSNNAFSYAASFGINEIPDEYKEEVKKGLNHVKHISVREDKGADIVENLIGKRPEVVLDPTLLLEDKEWDKIIAVPKNIPKKKFIVTYFLGKYSKERREYINKFAEKNNMEVVNLGQIKDKKYYYEGPSEFLYFIKNSEMVLTDSFHGSVFSILYKKTFYVLNREDNIKSMNSRIETLLNKFKLQGIEIKNYNQELNFKCDFSHVDDILKIEREKSMNFLKKAIVDAEDNKGENKSN